MSKCLSTIVFVENSKTLNLIETLNLIHVANLAKEKEALFAHIYALNFATVENASLASMKAH
jgi:hypothetical protein